jgi:hypothetical protein
MSVPSRVHVSLDLELTEGTIGGQMAVDSGPPSEFFGWLELIDRLQRASGGASDPATGPLHTPENRRG